ncbi:ATP-grasp domain-containing protein [Streptantibioticus silvisoli]|uniref:ATP-grasp domain-containing protein n=1 Tax=Streptantibioticus silvisoli TaxID=2705255 RepID=A0ABT6VZW1_9ACTN|nr:ATP-grasp domain-containing protein [Streptantibioticus silvisoli]MDI5964035.1 ATP-grasp domain-containing protein [Streptantibioticus silvisoli]
MRLYLLALNPTDSVTEGFLPAAARLGLTVTVLTEPGYVAAHREAYRAAVAPAGLGAVPEISGCAVRDFREVVGEISRRRAADGPFAVFSNSDHLQTQAALAAAYFGLPGKDWRATLRAKDKAETRRHLAAAGLGAVRSAELAPEAEADADVTFVPVPGAASVSAAVPVPRASVSLPGPAPYSAPASKAGSAPQARPTFDPAAFGVGYPCVVKPREGVASEDVVLVGDAAELRQRVAAIRARRPGQALVVEEFLPGELRTLETLGDAAGTRHVLGGFRTRLSPPPYFIEERLYFEPESPGFRRPGADQVLAQLDALGVGFGVCHTEYVTGPDGRARIIEVNYRAIGDQCDLMLADLLGIPLFEHILRTHLGEPLPRSLNARTDGRARQDAPLADRSGTLTAAPGPAELTVDETRLTYRPLRAVGEYRELTHTNRDYLGILRVTGTDEAAVDRVATGFLAAQRWEITP